MALSGGLAACGGGGGSSMTMTPDPMPDPPATVDMSMVTTDGVDYMAPVAGRLVIVPGMSETSGDVTFMCAAGGDDCVVTIAANGTATATGGMVTAMDSSAYTGRLATAAENQRVMDVASAREAAMGSYMDADGDAMKAEGQAEAAEAAAPGSPGAMAARTAATAARTAATAAKAAHDVITDGMTKTEADAQASLAASEAVNAKTSYMTAKRENDTIQTNVATNEELQRQRDVAAATTAADTAAMMARASATAARTNAGKARTAANAAKAAYEMAMMARTDSATARMEYMDADAAATAAETAATAAETAAMDAEAAHMGIDPAGTAEAAQMAKMTAETKQGEAADSATTASTQYMMAMNASGDAATAAGVHVLSLFKAANGDHVMDLESTMNMDEKAAHVTAVGAAMAVIATAADGAQAAGTTASATWPGDIAATEDAEAIPGMLMVSVDPAGSGTDIPFNLMAVADDPDTTEVETVIQTARAIADLGVFQGYDIWEDDGTAATGTDLHTGDAARVIAFTNKTQDDPPVAASDAVTARSVENVAVTTDTLTKLGTKSGNTYTYTGTEYTPTGEPALMGTLTCPSGVTCSVDATTAADGTVTINVVTGYVFTGSREAKAVVAEATAAQQATANNDYLVFGLWLDEANDGTGDAFGAFAAGGNIVSEVAVAITGTATYSGKAAGAHHMTGEGVNWFDGDANVTANFGADDAAGTISGMISNIRVAGGATMSAPIYLGQAGLAATFNGAAFMGAATAPGTSTHEFDGTWSGSLFGENAAVEDDTTTPDVDETMPAAAPDAVAGTFGVTKSETMGTGEDVMTIVESFVGAFGAHKD